MKGVRTVAVAMKKLDDKMAVKKAGATRVTKAKNEKAIKDPNKPKRPPSAFLLFMEEFRKSYKENFPDNKSVTVVGKAGGEKWKSLPDSEKSVYVEKAEKRKVEYTKVLQAYNEKKDEDNDSDKSKSELVNEEEGTGDSGEGVE